MSYSTTKRSSFGSRVRNYVSKNSGRRSGRDGRALSIRFHNWFRPPKERTTKIRLMPGAYKSFDGQENEYYPYVEHWCDRSRKSLICSKKYKFEDGEAIAIGGKCLACNEIEDDADDISWRVLHAFNAIHLAYYHLKPIIDDKGNHRTGGDDKTPLYNKVECEGRRCKHCKAGLKKVFGKKVHWSLGRGHLADLSGFVTEIEKDCVNCGGQGTIEVSSYECSKCGEIVIDMGDTDLEDGEIHKVISHQHTCRECGNKDLLLEVKECSNCEDPESLSVFDCDIEVKRTGEQKTSIQVPRWVPTNLTKEMMEEFGEPYNFEDIFKGDPFDIQAKLLKIRNPYADAEKHSEDYDKPDYD